MHCSHCPRFARVPQWGQGWVQESSRPGPEITPRCRGGPSETGEARLTQNRSVHQQSNTALFVFHRAKTLKCAVLLGAFRCVKLFQLLIITLSWRQKWVIKVIEIFCYLHKTYNQPQYYFTLAWFKKMFILFPSYQYQFFFILLPQCFFGVSMHSHVNSSHFASNIHIWLAEYYYLKSIVIIK